MKLCDCGCGHQAPLASKTNTKRGWIKGEPIRFLYGHNRRRPLEDRIWERVDKHGPNGCWLWIGYIHETGYGLLTINEVPRRAHRLVYELVVGPIPDGLHLDHLCRVPKCVNPGHLEPVTPRENVLRGISPAALHAKQTHCCRGHEFTPENTARNAAGRRSCRTCKRERRTDVKRRGIGHPRERTICPAGHPYDEANTYIDAKGGRVCRACGRDRMRQQRADEVPDLADVVDLDERGRR